MYFYGRVDDYRFIDKYIILRNTQKGFKLNRWQIHNFQHIDSLSSIFVLLSTLTRENYVTEYLQIE